MKEEILPEVDNLSFTCSGMEYKETSRLQPEDETEVSEVRPAEVEEVCPTAYSTENDSMGGSRHEVSEARS